MSMPLKRILEKIKELDNRLGEDTDRINLNDYISYKKQNGIVFVVGNGQGSCEIGDGEYTLVGTLPENFRPQKYFYFAWTGIGGDMNNQSARIETDGKISLYLPSGKTRTSWAFIISFPV